MTERERGGWARDGSREWSERSPALKLAPCGRPYSHKWTETVPLAFPQRSPTGARQGAGPVAPSPVPPKRRRSPMGGFGIAWANLGRQAQFGRNFDDAKCSLLDTPRHMM